MVFLADFCKTLMLEMSSMLVLGENTQMLTSQSLALKQSVETYLMYLKDDVTDTQISETKSTKIPLNVDTKIFKPRHGTQGKTGYCLKKTNIDNIAKNKAQFVTARGLSKD